MTNMSYATNSMTKHPLNVRRWAGGLPELQNLSIALGLFVWMTASLIKPTHGRPSSYALQLWPVSGSSSFEMRFFCSSSKEISIGSPSCLIITMGRCHSKESSNFCHLTLFDPLYPCISVFLSTEQTANWSELSSSQSRVAEINIPTFIRCKKS